MELTIQVPDEFIRQAEAHGLAPAPYAEKVLRDDLARSTGFPTLAQTRAAAARIREIRRGNVLGGLSIKDLISEGRKY